jgi:hypothetical protein
VENKSENAVSTTRGWNWDKKRSSLQKPGSRQDDKVMTNNIIRSFETTMARCRAYSGLYSESLQ